MWLIRTRSPRDAACRHDNDITLWLQRSAGLETQLPRIDLGQFQGPQILAPVRKQGEVKPFKVEIHHWRSEILDSPLKRLETSTLLEFPSSPGRDQIYPCPPPVHPLTCMRMVLPSAAGCTVAPLSTRSRKISRFPAATLRERTEPMERGGVSHQMLKGHLLRTLRLFLVPRCLTNDAVGVTIWG